MKVQDRMPGTDSTTTSLDRIETALRVLDDKIDAMVERVTEAIEKLDETITILETERRVDWYGGDMN